MEAFGFVSFGFWARISSSNLSEMWDVVTVLVSVVVCRTLMNLHEYEGWVRGHTVAFVADTVSYVDAVAFCYRFSVVFCFMFFLELAYHNFDNISSHDFCALSTFCRRLRTTLCRTHWLRTFHRSSRLCLPLASSMRPRSTLALPPP